MTWPTISCLTKADYDVNFPHLPKIILPSDRTYDTYLACSKGFVPVTKTYRYPSTDYTIDSVGPIFKDSMDAMFYAMRVASEKNRVFVFPKRDVILLKETDNSYEIITISPGEKVTIVEKYEKNSGNNLMARDRINTMQDGGFGVFVPANSAQHKNRDWKRDEPISYALKLLPPDRRDKVIAQMAKDLLAYDKEKQGS